MVCMRHTEDQMYKNTAAKVEDLTRYDYISTQLTIIKDYQRTFFRVKPSTETEEKPFKYRWGKSFRNKTAKQKGKV